MINHNNIKVEIFSTNINSIIQEYKKNITEIEDFVESTLLLFISLRKSLILENYLIYSQQELSNFIKTIRLIQTDKLNKETKQYDYTEKTLTIYVTTAIKEALKPISTIIKRRIRENEDFYPLFEKEIKLEDIFKETEENPVEDIFEESSSNNLEIKMIKLTQELEDYYLDDLLRFIPEFNNLAVPIKLRILNQEFTRMRNEKNFEEEKIKNFLKETIQESTAAELKILENKVDNHYWEISHLNEEINVRYQEIQTLNKKIESLNTPSTNIFQIDKIPKTIGKIYFNSQTETIEIYTQPIMLNIDRGKSAHFKNSPKIMGYLQKGYQFCIGYHLITINKALTLTFKELGPYKNLHIEKYNCYGTFAEHIDLARKEKNLQKLIFLAESLLKSATIGDVAGNGTILNAIVIDENGFVIEELSTKKEHPETHYLDLLRKGTLQHAINRTFL